MNKQTKTLYDEFTSYKYYHEDPFTYGNCIPAYATADDLYFMIPKSLMEKYKTQLESIILEVKS